MFFKSPLLQFCGTARSPLPLDVSRRVQQADVEFEGQHREEEVSYTHRPSGAEQQTPFVSGLVRFVDQAHVPVAAPFQFNVTRFRFD